MQDLFAKQLEALRAASLDRHLRQICSSQLPEIEFEGRRFLNFSSNDYLGLANDSARLRITVTAAHEENQIRSLCETIKRLSEIA